MWYPLQEKISSLKDVDYFKVQSLFESSQWLIQTSLDEDRKFNGIQIYDFHLKKRIFLTSNNFRSSCQCYTLSSHHRFITLFPNSISVDQNDHFYVFDLLKKRFYLKKFPNQIVSKTCSSGNSLIYFSVFSDKKNTIYRMKFGENLRFDEVYVLPEEHRILEIVENDSQLAVTMDVSQITVDNRSVPLCNFFKPVVKERLLEWAKKGVSYFYLIDLKKKEDKKIEVDAVMTKEISVITDELLVHGENSLTWENGNWKFLMFDKLNRYSFNGEKISTEEINIDGCLKMKVFNDNVLFISLEKKVFFSGKELTLSSSCEIFDLSLLSDNKTFIWYDHQQNSFIFWNDKIIWKYSLKENWVGDSILVSTRIFNN